MLPFTSILGLQPTIPMSFFNPYHKIRTQLTEQSTKILAILDKSDLHNVGRLLGILHKGALVFDEEGTGGTEVSHFSDFAIYDYYNTEGLNCVERYLSKNSHHLSGMDETLMKARLHAKSSLFSVIGTDPNISTVLLQDIMNDNHQVKITDIAMSKSTIIKDCLIFTRILTVDKINLTSGVSIMFTKDKEELLYKKYKSMIKQTVAYNNQAKNFIVFLKLNNKYGIHVNHEDIPVYN